MFGERLRETCAAAANIHRTMCAVKSRHDSGGEHLIMQSLLIVAKDFFMINFINLLLNLSIS